GHHREPVGAIAVEHMARRAVQNPTFAVTVCGHAVIHGGTGLVRVEPITGERRELAHRRQERGGIRRVPQLLEHDRQLHRTVRLAQLGKTLVQIGLPERARIDAVLGDATHQRGRTLLCDEVANGVLPQPLIGIELQQHGPPPVVTATEENNILGSGSNNLENWVCRAQRRARSGLRYAPATRPSAGPSQRSRFTNSDSGRRRTGPCLPWGQPTTTWPATSQSSGTPSASPSGRAPA